MADDVSTHELNQMIGFNLGKGFDFYPFGEIISSHKYKFPMARCWW